MNRAGELYAIALIEGLANIVNSQPPPVDQVEAMLQRKLLEHAERFVQRLREAGKP